MQINRFFQIMIISIMGSFILLACEKKERIEYDEPRIIKYDEPRIEVIESTNKQLKFRVHVPKIKLYDVQTDSGIFQRIKPPKSKYHMLLGGINYLSYPEILTFSTNVALPVDGKIDTITIEKEGKPFQIKARLYPIQRPLSDTFGEKDSVIFEFDKKIYLSRVTDIKQIISLRPLQKSNVNIFSLTLSLFDFNPAKESITWYSTFTVKIIFKGKLNVFRQTVPDTGRFKMDQIDKYFDSIQPTIIGSVINKNVVKEFTGPMPTPEFLGARLIIVTHPNFESASQSLRDRKESLGISTIITTTQTILEDYGDDTGNVTDVQIKNYLKAYYDGAFIKPKWLLLIGDSEFIPTHYTNQKNYWNSAYNAGDQFYGQLDDNDYSIPLFGIGRLPVDSDEEANIIVDKIIEYENNPPSTYGRYYNHLSFACMFQDNYDPENGYDGKADRWFAETTEHIRDYIVNLGFFISKFFVERIYWAPSDSNPTYWYDGTEIPEELQRPNFDWDGETTDIVTAVNNGSSLVYHRNHGAWNGWGHPSFRTDDLNSVNILGNEFPTVFSINCKSGIFDNETVDLPENIYNPDSPYGPNPNTVYWAEKFILKSDGAIGVIGGGMRSSGTRINNAFVKGLFDAVFPNYDSFGNPTSITMLGDILNHAKLYINAGFGDEDIFQENTIYNLLGDPTATVKTKPMWPFVEIIVPEIDLEHLRIDIKYLDLEPIVTPPPKEELLLREKTRVVAQSPKTKNIIGRGIEVTEGKIQVPIGKYRGELILTISSPDIITKKVKIVVK